MISSSPFTKSKNLRPTQAVVELGSYPKVAGRSGNKLTTTSSAWLPFLDVIPDTHLFSFK
jgi:hypothetical protein